MRGRRLAAEEDEEDAHPVMVPRSERALVAMDAERARRLRVHLVKTLRALRAAPAPVPTVAGVALPDMPALSGFAARVAVAACTLCEGWCCKGGGDHAYLDEPTMARRREATGLSARALLLGYLERIPAASHAGSCIYHGRLGCTLDRDMRSDICNNYFCNGLGGYVTGGDFSSPVVVIAGEGGRMRRSGILPP